MAFLLKNETALIAKAMNGDHEAFGSLYLHYYPWVWLAASKKARGDVDLAQEVTQTAFLEGWRDIKFYRHRGHAFGTWIYSIASHRLIDYYRTQKGAEFFPVEEIAKTHKEKFPLDRYIRQLDALAIQKITQKILTQKEQTVIREWFFYGRSYGEIGTILGKSANAVRCICARSLEKIRLAL